MQSAFMAVDGGGGFLTGVDGVPRPGRTEPGLHEYEPAADWAARARAGGNPDCGGREGLNL